MTKPPATAKWRDVKRVFVGFGIRAVEGKSVGHKRPRHAMLVDDAGNKYPIPAHNDGDDVYRTYILGTRRKFLLTPEHGMSDEDFWGRF
jgi:hypothetical protein